MTIKELIEKLQMFSPDATVLLWDGEYADSYEASEINENNDKDQVTIT